MLAATIGPLDELVRGQVIGDLACRFFRRLGLDHLTAGFLRPGSRSGNRSSGPCEPEPLWAEPEIGQTELPDLLALGRHDALQRWVSRLIRALHHTDHAGQRRLHLLKPSGDLATYGDGS